MRKRMSMIGEVHKNRTGLEYKIIGFIPGSLKKKGRYEVEFLATGYRATAQIGAIYKGDIKDRLHPSFWGVGKLGYAAIEDNKPAYIRWQAMIQRCYDQDAINYKKYGEDGVTVCERWHRLDYFLEDVIKLPGYDLLLTHGKEAQLDKDILSGGQIGKLYSPETCCFVLRAENMKHRRTNYAAKFKEICPDGTEIIHQNISALAKERGYSNSSIWFVLTGKRKTLFGSKFVRVDEDVQTTEKLVNN